MKKMCRVKSAQSVLLFSLVLQACQTKSVIEMTYAEQMQFADAMENRCLYYGLLKDAPKFHTCFMQETQAEEAKRFRARASWQDYVNHQRRLELAQSR